MANITYAGPLRSKGGFTHMGLNPLASDAVYKDFGTQYVRVVQVPTAEVLALNATPITVLPAVGATNYVKFDGAYVFQDYNSAAYDDGGADEDVSITYLSSGAAVSFTVDSGEFDTAADFLVWLPPLPGNAAGTSWTIAKNAGFSITAGGEFITGNSDWAVILYYTIIPEASFTGIA